MVLVSAALNFKTSLLSMSSSPAIASAMVLAFGTTQRSKYISLVSMTVFSFSLVTLAAFGTLMVMTAVPSLAMVSFFISWAEASVAKVTQRHSKDLPS